jgi:SpoVK/Ycf46/Vps4 family AAA+-type ATPase
MSLEDPGSVSFAGIGGLGDQVRELREVIELPLMNPELFEVSPFSAVFFAFPILCTVVRSRITHEYRMERS